MLLDSAPHFKQIIDEIEKASALSSETYENRTYKKLLDHCPH